MLEDRPIRTGLWRGTEVEYLAGHVVLLLHSEADSSAVDSLLSARGCFIIQYFDANGWGLIGCDTSASIFDKIDSLIASPLIDWAEPNGIVRPSSCPNDPYFVDGHQWALWDVSPLSSTRT